MPAGGSALSRQLTPPIGVPLCVPGLPLWHGWERPWSGGACGAAGGGSGGAGAVHGTAPGDRGTSGGAPAGLRNGDFCAAGAEVWREGWRVVRLGVELAWNLHSQLTTWVCVGCNQRAAVSRLVSLQPGASCKGNCRKRDSLSIQQVVCIQEHPEIFRSEKHHKSVACSKLAYGPKFSSKVEYISGILLRMEMGCAAQQD